MANEGFRIGGFLSFQYFDKYAITSWKLLLEGEKHPKVIVHQPELKVPVA